MKRRIVSLLMALCLCMGMLPTAAVAAEGTDAAASAASMTAATNTSNGKAIQMGTSGLLAPATFKKNFAYFGNYEDDTPIKWMTLDGTSTNTGAPGVFMTVYIPSEMLEMVNLNSYGDYKSLTDTAYVNLANRYFSQAEKAAILSTSKTDAAYSASWPAGQYISGEKLFSLSAEEIMSSSYFPIETFRSPNTSEIWLRSKYEANENSGMAVYGATAKKPIEGMMGKLLLRPAANIPAENILFTNNTTYTGDTKTNSALGSFSQVGATAENAEWKFTIKDSNRSFQVTSKSLNGMALTVNYSGAKTGTNEYISAALVDSGNNMLYYGRLKQADAAAGSATLDLSGINMADGLTLYFFNEQCNGAQKTDYSSPLVAVDPGFTAYTVTSTLTGLTYDGSTSVTAGTALDINLDVTDKENNQAPSSITVAMGGRTLTAGTEYKYYNYGNYGRLMLSSVTGNVEITASSVKREAHLAVDKQSLSFTACTGYTTSLSQTVKISAMDKQTYVVGLWLTGTNKDSFEKSFSGNSTYSDGTVSVGGSYNMGDTWSFKPKAGLSPGTYTATILARWSKNGMFETFQEIPVTFTVSDTGHDWRYTLNNTGDTITAACATNSGHKAQVKISAGDAEYGAGKNAKEYETASVTDAGNWVNYFGSLPAISYQGVYEAGQTVTAQITAGGQTAGVSYHITKASRTIAAPVEKSKTTDSVTLNAVAPSVGDGTVEYACSATNNAPADGWQTGTTFTGLTLGTTYYFFARVTGSTSYADATGSGAAITTLTHTHSWTYSASGATLTATCAGDSSHTASLTLSAANAVCTGGEQKTATLGDTSAWAQYGLPVPEIQYSGDTTNVTTDGVTAGITAGGQTASVNYRITPADLSADGTKSISEEYGKKLSQIAIPADLKAKLGIREINGTWEWVYTAGLTADTVLDAGTNAIAITARFTPAANTGNYNALTEKIQITIRKKQLNLSGVKWNIGGSPFTYDGKIKGVSLSGTMPAGVTVIKAGDTAVNAGNYTASAAFALADGYDEANYEITGAANPLTADWRINKAALALSGSATLVKNLQNSTATLDLTKISGYPAAPGGVPAFAVSGKTENGLTSAMVDAGGLLTLVSNADSGDTADTVTIRVTGMENYEDSTIAVTVSYIDKTPVTITGVSARNSIYNGQSQQGYSGKPASDYKGEYEISYNTPDGKAPTNAGSYTVTFKVPDSDPQYRQRL